MGMSFDLPWVCLEHESVTVVCPSPPINSVERVSERKNQMEGRCVGLDVHRDFCEVAVWEAGEVRRAPKVPARPEQLEQFAGQLGPADRVALVATGNALAIARIIKPCVAQVLIVNTRRLKAISESNERTPFMGPPAVRAGGWLVLSG